MDCQALELDSGNAKILLAKFKKEAIVAKDGYEMASDMLKQTEEETERLEKERARLQNRHDRAWEESKQSLKHSGKSSKTAFTLMTKVANNQYATEWKTIGYMTAANVSDTFFGVINMAINAPRLAAQTVESMARVKNPSKEPITKEPTESEGSQVHCTALGMAPMLLEKIVELESIINNDLWGRFREAGGKDSSLQECVRTLERTLMSLESGGETQPAKLAKEALNRAIQVRSPQWLLFHLTNLSQVWMPMKASLIWGLGGKRCSQEAAGPYTTWWTGLEVGTVSSHLEGKCA